MTSDNVKFYKRNSETYVIMNPPEKSWAVITLNEKLGLFQCISYYGIFSYIWTGLGDIPIKEFLLSMDANYFFETTRLSDRLVFSLKNTIEYVKERIIEARRFGFIDKEVARVYYDEIKIVENNTVDACDYWRNMKETQLFKIFFKNDEYYVPFSKVLDPECKSFWEHIWMNFLEILKKEKEK